MRKWIFIVALIAIALVAYLFLYQDHRDIASETSFNRTTAIEIYAEFKSTPKAALNTYLNKTIEVSGNITDFTLQTLTLNDKVFCHFNGELDKKITTNSLITVKGRVIGFDDLLEELKLDQCTIIN